MHANYSRCIAVVGALSFAINAGAAINFASTRIASYSANVPEGGTRPGAKSVILRNGATLHLPLANPADSLILDIAGSRTEVPSRTDPVTGFPVSYGLIQEFDFDGDSVAFLTDLGIYLWETGHVKQVAAWQAQMPGQPAGRLFTAFSGCSIARFSATESAVVFVGIDGVSGYQAIFRYRKSAGLERIADTTMTAPSGGLFAPFGRPIADGRDIVFASGSPLFRYRDGQFTDLLAGTAYANKAAAYVAQDGAVAFSVVKGIGLLRNGAIEPVAGPITFIDGIPYKLNYLFRPWGVNSRDVIFSAEWTTPYIYSVPPGNFTPPIVVKSKSRRIARAGYVVTNPYSPTWGVRRGGVNHKLLIDGKAPLEPPTSIWGHSMAYGIVTGFGIPTGGQPPTVSYLRADETGWAPRPVPAFYDGDLRADIAFFEPASGHWPMRLTQSTNIIRQFGYEGSTQSPADYDGDGLTDLAVYDASQDGAWYVNGSSAGFQQFGFGFAGTVPVPADYDGDGDDDAAVYARDTGQFYVRNADGSAALHQFGVAGATPVVGDYDGDGRADPAVFVHASGMWLIAGSSSGFQAIQFGSGGSVPVPGDFDGDGRTDLAVYESGGGYWFVQGSTAGFSSLQFGFGGVQPFVCDFDGDGSDDKAVYYPYDRTWYIQATTDGFVIK